jgi:hypothetical protein
MAIAYVPRQGEISTEKYDSNTSRGAMLMCLSSVPPDKRMHNSVPEPLENETR